MLASEPSQADVQMDTEGTEAVRERALTEEPDDPGTGGDEEGMDVDPEEGTDGDDSEACAGAASATQVDGDQGDASVEGK